MARRRTAEADDDNEVLVKVGRSGGRVEEYSLTGDEPTVADALAAASISISKGDRIRLNGETADEDEVVEDGDIITVAGKVSGGKV